MLHFLQKYRGKLVIPFMRFFSVWDASKHLLSMHCWRESWSHDCWKLFWLTKLPPAMEEPGCQASPNSRTFDLQGWGVSYPKFVQMPHSILENHWLFSVGSVICQILKRLSASSWTLEFWFFSLCWFTSRCDHHHRNGKQHHCGIQPMASEVNVGAKPPARASHATLGTQSTKSKSNQELKRQEAGHPGNIGNLPSDGKK